MNCIIDSKENYKFDLGVKGLISWSDLWRNWTDFFVIFCEQFFGLDFLVKLSDQQKLSVIYSVTCIMCWHRKEYSEKINKLLGSTIVFIVNFSFFSLYSVCDLPWKPLFMNDIIPQANIHSPKHGDKNLTCD